MKNSIKVKAKRFFMFPFTKLKFKLQRMFHSMRKSEEVIKRRDEMHDKFIVAERSGNKAKADEYRFKKLALCWVLKETEDANC